MTCHYPVDAWRLHKPRNGKVISFRPVPRSWGSAISLPCYKCAGCRLERSRQWAMRCVHESKMHKQNCFVTLTYRNDDLPEFGTLVPEHLKNFHKRLHNRLLRQGHDGIRYYACGEYGDQSQRPHYHTLLFGFDPPDKRLYSGSEDDENAIYSSRMLDETWGFGDVRIGAVTFDSAAYVARYCMKKVDGPQRAAGHYLVYDADGLVHEREPEFARMSLKPGIGATYFRKYGAEILQHDSVIVNAREVPSNRYYDKLIDERFLAGPDPYRLTYKNRQDKNKIDRKRASDKSERTPERLAVKAELLRQQLNQKKRSL